MSTNDNSTITVMSFLTSLPAAFILGMVAIGLWMGVFIQTSKVISNGVSWPSISGQVTKVISSTMLGMFILLITSLIYFLQDQTKSIYVIFILIAFASALSYSAMAASSAS